MNEVNATLEIIKTLQDMVALKLILFALAIGVFLTILGYVLTNKNRVLEKSNFVILTLVVTFYLVVITNVSGIVVSTIFGYLLLFFTIFLFFREVPVLENFKKKKK